MARMIPSEFTGKTGSERRIFERLAEGLSSEWVAIHSVDLAHHPTKPWAEIDYVLIGPRGILCCEVKGGVKVECDGKRWFYTDRDGRTVVRNESPFAQVGGASSALYQWLVERDPSSRALPVAWAVQFPFTKFTIEGPGVVPEVVYDSEDELNTFEQYVARVFSYWEERMGRGRASLDKPAIDRLVRRIAPAFALAPRLDSLVAAVRDELVKLTIDQAAVLAGFASNPRAFVTGGAGTGKTMLAVAEARRLSDAGKRVLLCCYNRNLGTYLHRETLHDGIAAGTLHGVMHQVAEAAGTLAEIPKDVSDTDYYGLFLPDAAAQGLRRAPELAYDCLVIDEGQDLLNDAYSDVLDALVVGGIQDGSWRVFRDPGQDIYGGISLGGLSKFSAARPMDYPLDRNCRNTQPIAVQTAVLSDRRLAETAEVDGPQPVISFFRDQAEEVRIIAKAVNRLLSDGLQPEDIVILGPRRLENSCVAGGLKGVPCEIESWRLDPGPRTVRYETIRAFKGLEAVAVLVVDLDSSGREGFEDDLYVACSRPMAYLQVSMHEDLKLWYESQVEAFGERLFEAPELPAAGSDTPA